MNEIINWLALNNTLMIRIGFSAVILLIVVYVFRFFFVPSVKQVSEVAESSDADVSKVEVSKPESTSSDSISSEELTKLQAEISTLKYKLKEAEAEKNTLAAQSVSASSAVSAGAAGVEMVSESQANSAKAPVADTTAQKELEEKVKMLEARLQEYEIIAEDIAEVGRLRQENETLKAKITQVATEVSVAEVAQPEPEVQAEPVTEDLSEASQEASASDLLDSYVSAKTTPVEVNDMSRIVITSDVEVTPEEKNALNDFENFQMKKKG